MFKFYLGLYLWIRSLRGVWGHASQLGASFGKGERLADRKVYGARTDQWLSFHVNTAQPTTPQTDGACPGQHTDVFSGYKTLARKRDSLWDLRIESEQFPRVGKGVQSPPL